MEKKPLADNFIADPYKRMHIYGAIKKAMYLGLGGYMLNSLPACNESKASIKSSELSQRNKLEHAHHVQQKHTEAGRLKQEQVTGWNNSLQLFANQFTEKAVEEEITRDIGSGPISARGNAGISTESTSTSLRFPRGAYEMYHNATYVNGAWDTSNISADISQTDKQGSGSGLLYVGMQRRPNGSWGIQINRPYSSSDQPMPSYGVQYYATDGVFSDKIMHEAKKAVVYILGEALSPMPTPVGPESIPDFTKP